ncbi:MAG: sodium:alanine symporter family protein, partial [Duodenibacillus sp.]|nr:sodium:alanine symporter family protein [Duodenibacillus sp.]
MQWLVELNNFVWGPCMLVLLFGTGIYLTIGLRFFTFRHFAGGLRNAWQGRGHHQGAGEISPFNALMTALAGDVGTGNIVGVATAIFVGGPGALFWMWMTALVGMATKFCEVLLAVKYREKTPNGSYVGGAMYFIKNGLGPKFKPLAAAFAFFGIIACTGSGGMVQGNAIGGALEASFSIPPLATAAVLLVVSGTVLLGGVKRIAKVAGSLVPAMSLIYCSVSLVIILLNYDQIIPVFTSIIKCAFTPAAAEGGFAGAGVMMAIRMGMARG